MKIAKPPQHHASRLTMAQALCRLELENHQRVIWLLRKRLADFKHPVPHAQREEGIVEIRNRRALIADLRRQMRVNSSRRGRYERAASLCR